MSQQLDAEELGRAVATLRAWRHAPKAEYACPKCGAPGVAIDDRSARPHAEWFHFACTACGLSESINIPMCTHTEALD